MEEELQQSRQQVYLNAESVDERELRSVTLSPQIDLLAHVRNVKKVLDIVFQVAVSLITLKNLVSGTSAPRETLGIWKRREVDLKRYGCGGV